MAAMSMVRILHLAPGEAECDPNRQFASRIADPPLTDHGRAQVERVASTLAGQRLTLHDEILASPLKRAQETAMILAQQLGGTVRPDERLRDINVGDLDGRSDDEAWRIYTEIVHRRWAAGEWSRRFPNGEHLRNLAQRIRGALLQAAQPEIGAQRTDVLVVGHAAGLRAALPYLIKNVEDAYPHVEPGPCSFSCFLAGPASRPAVLRLVAFDVPPTDVGRLTAERTRQLWETI